MLMHDSIGASEQSEPCNDLSQTQGRRFRHDIEVLNTEDPKRKRYKLFYIIRHGLGVHNAKKTEVGREAWSGHWSKLPGDETSTWLDTKLTSEGEQQATAISSLWISGGIQPLQSIYSSPLRRCLRTTEHAFAPGAVTPIIKEKLRERLGVQTCDQRSSRSWNGTAYPRFRIEDDIAAKDELWQADRRERFEEHVERSVEFLGDIFTNDNTKFVALMAHSRASMALFRATSWGKIPIAEGAVYPFLVWNDEGRR